MADKIMEQALEILRHQRYYDLSLIHIWKEQKM